MARTFGNDVYYKPHGPYWYKYNGEDIVILENVHPHHGGGMETDLLHWADKFPFTGMTDGFSANTIRPKKFVVTSQYSIEEVFGEGRTCEAMSRRFHVIHMPNKWEPPVLEEAEREAFSS